MDETYLNWYKRRMSRFLDSESISLVSSSVKEPWIALKNIHQTPDTRDFEDLYWTANPYGHPGLIERISCLYGVSHNNILLTQGATSAIFLICQTLLEPGDHVIVETPFYEPLVHSPVACGAKISYLNRKSGFDAMMCDLRLLLRHNTKLLILTDLQNPTGDTLKIEQLEMIAEIARSVSPHIRIMVDEIYLDFLPDRRRPAFEVDPVFISVSSLTKVYGLSILRCGWVFAEYPVIEKLRERQVLLSGIGSRYLETLSIQVLDNLPEIKHVSHEHLHRNIETCRECFRNMIASETVDGEINRYGCISFLRITDVDDTRGLTDYLEKTYKLFVVPGAFFGAPEYIRLGIGEVETSELVSAAAYLTEGIQAYRNSVR